MNNKAVIGIAVLGIAALATTVGIFAAGGGGAPGEDEIRITGHLSRQVLEVETTYKELQQRWKDNEKNFKEKKFFPELGKLNGDCEKLQGIARAAKGDSDAEKAAVPHLLESIEAFREVLPTYIMFFVNEPMLKPENWEKAKQDAMRSNAAWRAWQEATKSLSREAVAPAPK